LIKIKNAAMAGNKTVKVTANSKIVAIAQSLKKAGYFDDVKKDSDGLTINLTFKDKKPLIMNMKLVSKPGRRIYLGVLELEKKRGPSQYFLSTPKGIMSGKEAIKQRVGGEVLVEIL